MFLGFNLFFASSILFSVVVNVLARFSLLLPLPPASAARVNGASTRAFITQTSFACPLRLSVCLSVPPSASQPICLHIRQLVYSLFSFPKKIWRKARQSANRLHRLETEAQPYLYRLPKKPLAVIERG